MNRRVGAPVGAGRATVGKDLGRSPQPRKGEGTARNRLRLDAP